MTAAAASTPPGTLTLLAWDAAPPPRLGFVGPEVPYDTLVERLIEYVGYTPYHNVVGAPSMSVPDSRDR